MPLFPSGSSIQLLSKRAKKAGHEAGFENSVCQSGYDIRLLSNSPPIPSIAREAGSGMSLMVT
jgi:hypothetical protein